MLLGLVDVDVAVGKQMTPRAVVGAVVCTASLLPLPPPAPSHACTSLLAVVAPWLCRGGSPSGQLKGRSRLRELLRLVNRQR